jgi:hypothetical protein
VAINLSLATGFAHWKISPRAKGDRFGKSRRAARREATARLLRLGYTEAQAAVIVKDAHDMFLLEANARED